MATKILILKLTEGITQGSYLRVNVSNQLLDLPLGVQQLDSLSVRVVTHTKWSGDAGGKITENNRNPMSYFC